MYVCQWAERLKANRQYNTILCQKVNRNKTRQNMTIELFICLTPAVQYNPLHSVKPTAIYKEQPRVAPRAYQTGGQCPGGSNQNNTIGMRALIVPCPRGREGFATPVVASNGNMRDYQVYEDRKDIFYLTTQTTHFIYGYNYGFRHVVKDQGDSQRGNPLSSHGELMHYHVTTSSPYQVCMH